MSVFFRTEKRKIMKLLYAKYFWLLFLTVLMNLNPNWQFCGCENQILSHLISNVSLLPWRLNQAHFKVVALVQL
jgi:hypothetical protein